MANYYGTDPCPDCDGHGWTPDGHQCRECDGTGRMWARVTTFYTPELGEQESINVKVSIEVNQVAGWEREDRRKELEDLPELKAKVEEVEAMYQREMEIQRQFSRCKGPYYEAWVRKQQEREQREFDEEMVHFTDLGGEYLPRKEGRAKLARMKEAKRRRLAEEGIEE